MMQPAVPNFGPTNELLLHTFVNKSVLRPENENVLLVPVAIFVRS